MTNEDAIEYLKWIRPKKPWSLDNKNTQAAIDKAIKALEQETCEDCISRHAVLDALDNHTYFKEFCEEHNIDWSINLGMAHIVINDLPPVTPQPKTGKWIKFVVNNRLHKIRCDKCDYTEPEYATYIRNYCPNCGCKMVDTQESEE